MKLVIPALSGEGLSAEAGGHFGSAPFFVMFNTDSRETTVAGNSHQEHEHGACNPIETIRGLGADAVLCQGMGARAVMLLAREGIAVFRCDYPTVGEMVSAWENGERTIFTPAHACSGHGCG